MLGLAAIGTVLWFWPATEILDGPRKAVLRSSVPGLEAGISAQWYDLRLNPKAMRENLDFAADGTARLPVYALRTSVGRIWLKRLLLPHGQWTECENCYGPIAFADLYRKNDYTPPDKTRLAQNARTAGDTLEFTISLLPDETQYEERPLVVGDLDALMAEVRAILQAGPDENVPSEAYGPELRRLNPVRTESYRNGMRVWMGGKVGYNLSPDELGGPLVNGAWMTGTDYRGIQKIERM